MYENKKLFIQSVDFIKTLEEEMRDKIFKWIGVISSYVLLTVYGRHLVILQLQSEVRDTVLDYVGFSLGALGMWILFESIGKSGKDTTP